MTLDLGGGALLAECDLALVSSLLYLGPPRLALRLHRVGQVAHRLRRTLCPRLLQPLLPVSAPQILQGTLDSGLVLCGLVGGSSFVHCLFCIGILGNIWVVGFGFLVDLVGFGAVGFARLLGLCVCRFALCLQGLDALINSRLCRRTLALPILRFVADSLAAQNIFAPLANRLAVFIFDEFRFYFAQVAELL